MRIAIFHVSYSQFGVDSTPLSYIMSSLEKDFPEDIIYPVNDIDTLIETEPDIICFYLKESFVFNKLLDILNQIQNINKPKVLLGEHITALPKTLPKSIEIGILGEYEETICDLISVFKQNNFLDKKSLSKIKGILFYDENKKLVLTEKRNYIKNIDNLEFTRKNFYGMPGFWIPTIVTGRGNCFKNIFTQFTDVPIRLHSYEWLMGNCVDIITYFPNIDYVEIQDYLFLYDKQRFLEFSKIVKETNLSNYFRFIVNSFPKQLDDEILYALKENLNVLKLNISLFSTIEKIQNDVKENICTRENLISILDKCQDLDIEVNLIFGIGSSIETQEDIAKHYWFIENNIKDKYSNRIDISHKLYLPVPSSESWIRLNKKLQIDKITDFSLIDNNNFNEKSLFLNDNISFQDLNYIKKYLYDKYTSVFLIKNEQEYIKLDNKVTYKLKKYIDSDKLKEDLEKIYPNDNQRIFNEIKKHQNNYVRYGSYKIKDNNEFIYKDLSLFKKLKDMIEKDYINFSEIDKYFSEIDNLYYSTEIDYFFKNKNILTLPILDIIDFINKNHLYIKNILQISENTYNILDLLDKDRFNFEYMENNTFNNEKPKLILDKKFDCIICIFTLNFCINDMRLMRYIHSILNKEGILIISFLNSKNIINIRNIFLNRDNQCIFNRKILKSLSIEYLSNLLKKYNFNILEIKNIKVPSKGIYLGIDKILISFIKKLYNINYEYNNFITTVISRKYN